MGTEAQKAGGAAAQTVDATSLLDQVIAATRPQDQKEAERLRADFVSLVTHELAHSLLARRYGVEVRGITLWMFGGVSELEAELSSPRDELRMAIAGPATSVGLGLAFLGASLLATASSVPESGPQSPQECHAFSPTRPHVRGHRRDRRSGPDLRLRAGMGG